jgi:hypothetical protein
MINRVTHNTIPDRFLQWLVRSRVNFLQGMEEGRPLRYFSAHLPVMATWCGAADAGRPSDESPGGCSSSSMAEPFVVNMTVKGIGLIPSEEKLLDFTDILEGAVADARTKAWRESLPRRIEVMRRLYSSPDNFDPTLLGGLEIFEGKAFNNIKENPYASLLYTGMSDTEGGLKYISFQINGRVEIIDKDDPYYRYLLASRRLFEFERFHLYQPDYPFGYLIRVLEVRDKSPWSRGQNFAPPSSNPIPPGDE